MNEESFERVTERGLDTAAETDSESVLRLNLITVPSPMSNRSIVLWGAISDGAVKRKPLTTHYRISDMLFAHVRPIEDCFGQTRAAPAIVIVILN